jgi:rod shape-determining protein MreC
MPLGTLDRTPPPFFRQGPSALTKLMFCSALAIFLMVADTRFKVTQPLRSVLATVLLPVQRTLLVPVDAWNASQNYIRGLEAAVAAQEAAQRELAMQAERSVRMDQLVQENARLRALLELRPGLQVRSQSAEVLYEAPDPYTRKVVIDRGATQGVRLGSPVVNEHGVLGQVTRVYPLSAEITLLNDKDAAIPVLNTRTQQRSAAFGNSDGDGMELRFLSGNADVQIGDVLTTSGVDGVYPPGMPVAKVVRVARRAETGFAKIDLALSASGENLRHVLVLEPVGLQLPPKEELAVDPPPRSTAVPTSGKKGARK